VLVLRTRPAFIYGGAAAPPPASSAPVAARG